MRRVTGTQTLAAAPADPSAWSLDPSGLAALADRPLWAMAATPAPRAATEAGVDATASTADAPPVGSPRTLDLIGAGQGAIEHGTEIAPLTGGAAGDGAVPLAPEVALAAILFLGVGAQWLAWRLKLPSILMLLTAGFLAGPVAGWATGGAYAIDPEATFGRPLLLTLVSLAVGLVLFEGGLTLNWREIVNVRSAVRNLVTIGAVVTWVIAGLAAHYCLGLTWPMATLLGAVLIVTGPTVIGPLLRFVRPAGPVGSVLKWEGIVIDPIGALAAVLVFEAILSGAANVEGAAGSLATAGVLAWGAVKTTLVGTGVGVAAAGLLVLAFRKLWVPDHLQTPVTLVLVAAAFTASNFLVHESGLFTTTVMGMVLANQPYARIRHIAEFKETLTVLLIAALFVVLSAQLEFEHFTHLGWGAVVFLLILIVVARPLAVLASTVGSSLTWAERGFLMWMAPRGIVAASVASVFALRLEGAGVAEARLLVPYTFMVIIATVALYGLTAALVAARLKLASPSSAGFLIAGAGTLGRAIGQALQQAGSQVLVVDTNHGNTQAARLAGLPTIQGNVLGHQVQERIELSGIGRLLALTPNDEVNSLSALQYAKHFGRSNVYQLDREADEKRKKRGDVDDELNGRVLFGKHKGYRTLVSRLESGGTAVRSTKLSKEFTFDRLKQQLGPDALPLFVVTSDGGVQVFTADSPPTPKAGQTVISLGPPKEVKDPKAKEAERGRSADGAAGDSVAGARVAAVVSSAPTPPRAPSANGNGQAAIERVAADGPVAQDPADHDPARHAGGATEPAWGSPKVW